jgi:UDP:flavonoid glycosyltransferase YjiC (YdhE family)
MRVLFSTTAGTGHFGPLIPVAEVCVRAGHEVAVAAPAGFHEAVTRAGFTHLSVGEPPLERMRDVFRRVEELPRTERSRVVLGEIFAGLDAQAALPSLTRIMVDWPPDLVVHEPFEFASLVAAEAVGIPQLQVAIGMAQLGLGVVDIIEKPLADLSRMAGLPAARGQALVLDATTLTSVPPSLDAGNLRVGGPSAETAAGNNGRVWRFRHGSPVGNGPLPDAWGDPDQPLIYVSYGSVTAAMRPLVPLYGATLRVLADFPVRVLLTTGRGLDPETLGDLPTNTRVAEWWPQADVMREATAVVGHGGFGTTMAAVTAGLPQIVIPLFAFDQGVNADRVAAVHAGITLSGGLQAVAALPDALRQLLDDPAFRVSAEAIAAEIAALPDVSECLPLLEEFAS